MDEYIYGTKMEYGLVTPEYQRGFNEGYAVARQEMKYWLDQMGKGHNRYTGTICAREEF
jgi:hypothetical protein